MSTPMTIIGNPPITLTGDITASGHLLTPVATTLSSFISPALGQTFNFNVSNSDAFLNLNIGSSSVTQSILGMGQTVTYPGTSYAWIYSRPVVSPAQTESYILNYTSVGSLNVPLMGISQSDEYVTIYNGLHMNSQQIDTVSNLQFLSNNAAPKIALWAQTSPVNAYQYIGMFVASSTFGLQVPSATNDFVFNAALSSSSNSEVFRIKGNGDIVYSGNMYGNVPSGSMYMEGNGSSTTITTSGTYYKLNGTTTSVNLNQFIMSTNNRLTFAGDFSITAFVIVSATLTQNQLVGSNVTVSIFKNGSRITGTSGIATIPNADYASISVNTIIGLAYGDYLELYVTGSVNGQTATASTMQFTVESI
jgi:hypothetical protein